MRIIRHLEREKLLDHLTARSVALDSELMKTMVLIVDDVNVN